MISEHRSRVRQILGDQRSEELRLILRNVLVQKWDIPQHRFSPLMLEHLLYFIAQAIPIIETELFCHILSLKFIEEYGYEHYPNLLPKIIEDLVGTLRTYCKQHFTITQVAPSRAIEKVFKEPLLLYLDGYKIDSKSDESIWKISGLPLSFLSTFIESFSRVLEGESISDDMEHNFGHLYREIKSLYMFSD